MTVHSLLAAIPRRPVPALVAAAACALGVTLVAAPSASAARATAAPATHSRIGTVKVVASGLDNPRGLAFVGGHLYVAEAGHGGTLCFPGGEEGDQCAGLTSGISKIENGRHRRVVDGLISLAGKDGTAAEGVVAVAGHRGLLYAQVGANSRALPPNLPSGPVVERCPPRARPHPRDRAPRPLVADRVDGERGLRLDGGPQEPPAGPVPRRQPERADRAGRSIYVADAGANLLARVGRHGHVKTVAYFQVAKGSTTDAVPTCVANAPDGSLYVGELLGGSFAPGHARVWQVWPNGKARVKWTGFTGIQGCGFDNRGNFYVTEFQAHGMFGPDPHGAVVQIRPNGHRTTFGGQALFFPSGFAYCDGKVYVSNWSTNPAKPASGPSGQVVSITVAHGH